MAAGLGHRGHETAGHISGSDVVAQARYQAPASHAIVTAGSLNNN